MFFTFLKHFSEMFFTSMLWTGTPVILPRWCSRQFWFFMHFSFWVRNVYWTNRWV